MPCSPTHFQVSKGRPVFSLLPLISGLISEHWESSLTQHHHINKTRILSPSKHKQKCSHSSAHLTTGLRAFQLITHNSDGMTPMSNNCFLFSRAEGHKYPPLTSKIKIVFPPLSAVSSQQAFPSHESCAKHGLCCSPAEPPWQQQSTPEILPVPGNLTAKQPLGKLCCESSTTLLGAVSFCS